MALDASDIESIRDIFDARADKLEKSMERMETQVFNEIEKIAAKVDGLSDGQQYMAERVTRLEGTSTILADSRQSQGMRIGQAENAIVVMQTEMKTLEKYSDKNFGKNQVIWSLIIGISAVLSSILISVFKP